MPLVHRRARVPLELFDEVVRLADKMPASTPAERAELLCALAQTYRESIRAGAEYRPLGEVTKRNQN